MFFSYVILTVVTSFFEILFEVFNATHETVGIMVELVKFRYFVFDMCACSKEAMDHLVCFS